MGGWEKQGERETRGSCSVALPANSRKVTLGERQDKSFYADRAKQPLALSTQIQTDNILEIQSL